MAPIGRIYFAAVDTGDVYNPAIHSVEDEDVFGLAISQVEFQFAIAEVKIKNPSEGLLSPTRKQRVFLSIDNGGSPKLIFSGEIVGIPSEIATNLVTIQYIGQPSDWEVVQQTLFDSLKVSPFFNPLFAPESRRNSGAEILAARNDSLNWDRRTNTVTLTNILEGSQLIDLAGDYRADSLRINVGDPPVRIVNINIEAQWEQVGIGEVDVGTAITAEFTNTITTPQLNTLTPLAFEDGWNGVTIPAGYTIKETKLTPVADAFGLVQGDLRSAFTTVDGADFPTAANNQPPQRVTSVPRVWYIGSMKLQAVYQQKRREVISAIYNMPTQDFALKSNLFEDLNIRIQNPTAAQQGSILDRKAASFFWDIAGDVLTADGRDVIEHALLRANAITTKASRIVEVQFDAGLIEMIDVTLDHSIRLVDARFPGGSFRGKVIGYTFNWDGDTGQNNAQITLGGVIGTGADSVGTGAPSETQIGTRVYDNEFGAATMTSAIFYDVPVFPVIDEPIDVVQMEASDSFLIDGVTVTDDGESQNTGFEATSIIAPFFGDGRPDTFLQNNRTKIEVDLKSMNPEAELFAQIDVTVEDVTVPRQTDLEA